jgi:hypothetical protein
MNVDDQFELEHLYLTERTCRICGQSKDLIDGFYRIRKNKYLASSYSYECKACSIKRIMETRKNKKKKNASKSEFVNWEYPDW